MNVEPIGFIESCYKEKFGIPRQAGLVQHATARLILLAPFNHSDYVRELERFSHLWLIFIFHANLGDPKATCRPLIRPPKLGGKHKVGVFASRSPFRPNALGLSAVKLERIEHHPTILHLSGIDLLDGTPIVDIKPYLPYADSLPHAQCGYAPPPHTANLTIRWSPQALNDLTRINPHPDTIKHHQSLIEALIRQDPRPSYQPTSLPRVYGVKLDIGDVRWKIDTEQVEILQIAAI